MIQHLTVLFGKVSQTASWAQIHNCSLQNGTLQNSTLPNGRVLQNGIVTKRYSYKTVYSPKSVHITKQHITKGYSNKTVHSPKKVHITKHYVTKWYSYKTVHCHMVHRHPLNHGLGHLA